MTTFMCDDPETSSREARKETVERPSYAADKLVQRGVGEGDVLWVDERDQGRGGIVDGSDGSNISKTVRRRYIRACGVARGVA